MKAVQSAMAIRRQRRRRDEALRAKARRASHQSDHLMLSDSGDAGSMLSLDGVHNNNHNGGGSGSRSAAHRHRQMMGGITTFHVGVVFFIMGLMLLISGILPGYANRQHQYWEEPKNGGTTGTTSTSIWNRDGGSNRNAPLLLVTGSFLILVGIALVVANRIATRREDELFSRYISRKLAPARMTHQPVSSLLHPTSASSSNGHKDEMAGSSDDLHRVISESPSSSQLQEPQCQSPGQLESITEESEAGGGAERPPSKDELFWTSDVAPVHHHHHHHRGHHHHHNSNANNKVLHSDEQDKCNHDNHNHHVGSSSTG
ncbi:uncharacterized protein LOC124197544 isoform X1 [Daphnia pulex]|uniref:uncharacterized protein LOC124197544 isoform X1 n=1 Tax=Daphnia pulex TaxID=6669 RepID=UPI001EDFE54C|nr:uncharacterized protein LOC124197544 isoform X1 [Daphnia pulex]